MRRHRFFKYLPTAQSLQDNRFLKPFGRYLEHHSLWQFNRRAVAGGVAVGLFFGILIPFAQILLAAIAAIVMRVNLPVAAFSTLVTNPFTFAGVYYFAYRIGGFLTHPNVEPAPAVIEAEVQMTIEARHEVLAGWFSSAIEWFQSVGLQLVTGLSVLAVASAIVGYFTVTACWRLWVHKRWQKRRLRSA